MPMSNKVYRALADPTRRRILELLRGGDLTAGQLAAHFGQTKPTLSRHFSVLQEADLIQGDRAGRTITYHLNVSVLEEALLAMMSLFGMGPAPRDGDADQPPPGAAPPAGA
ncbi:MAG: autorepressor SdpR family transcription factor [Gemmatimonadota bacterium]